MSHPSNYQKRRLFSSYFWVVVSLFLVLFLLGLQGFLLLNSQQLANYFREQVPMSIYFKDTAKDLEMKQLETTLQMADYTKSAVFVSSEEGAKKTQESLGEDFVEQLGGFNPIPNSIDIRLNAQYVTQTDIDTIVEELSSKPYIQEIRYDKPLVSLLNQNVKKISFYMLILSGVFVLIAFLLINSSIRLSVYAKRFTIKTMQMVGATKGFIRRPFIWTSLKLGLIGAVLALAALSVVVYYADRLVPELSILENYEMLGLLIAGVIGFGLLISLISTFFATTRYLNLRTDQLYY
ncbi:cell divonision protein FtsX [Nonlabens tegetincola]|uniref:Cell division protein FtsX n=1 Tax=Nonlabens tegetincola TaxID=323273 RepID=A0A090PYY3_9FLAO|nr:permease-like cell division protein FtsX [Nonlabens tegetincola]GAK95965.1 cell divonision protein FtsX [Nonlabens tegetincola]